jgi:hypothetical protein
VRRVDPRRHFVPDFVVMPVEIPDEIRFAGSESTVIAGTTARKRDVCQSIRGQCCH